jgi:hypothetical protein
MSFGPHAVNRTPDFKPNPNNELLFGDVKTLAVSDLIKDRALTLRLMSSVTKQEIAKSIIDVSKACYI